MPYNKFCVEIIQYMYIYIYRVLPVVISGGSNCESKNPSDLHISRYLFQKSFKVSVRQYKPFIYGKLYPLCSLELQIQVGLLVGRVNCWNLMGLIGIQGMRI